MVNILSVKTGDLILCEWEDSYGCSPTWQTIQEDVEPLGMVCKSVGWVMRKSKKFVVIVPHLSRANDIADQQGCGDMTIPTASIVRIKRISAFAFCALPAPNRKQPRF
jgi:hypothetical protein